MYARVARFEGARADGIRAVTDEINSAAEPPEGLPSVGILMLADPDNGRTLTISLFETEEDRRKGDETLNAMTPTGGGLGRRTSVEFYDVAVDRRASSSMPA